MDMLKDLKEGLVSELKPIREGIKHLPKAVTFPQYPSITAYDDGEEEGKTAIGNIFEQFLRKFAFTSSTDKTFGLRDKDGKFYIGSKEAKIKENNIVVGEEEYAGMPRLWELIVATTPDGKIFSNGDYDNYAEIMISTNALKEKQGRKWNKTESQHTLEMEAHIKNNLGWKDLCTGNGLITSDPVITLPCDSIALVERLDILMASKAAGKYGCKEWIGIKLGLIADTELDR